MPTNPLDNPAKSEGQGFAIHPALLTVFEALDRGGVEWALLRGEGDLLRPSGDVDLLVAARQLTVLDGLLDGEGFCRVRAAGHGSHRFYFHYSTPDDLWLKLDIVTEIAFGPYQQLRSTLAPGCLDRRVRSGSLWLPALPDKAWLQLLHLVLDKGEIQPQREEIARSAAAMASADDVIAKALDVAVGCETASQLLDLIRTSSFEAIPGMAAHMRSAWAGGPSNGAPWRATTSALTNRALRLLGARLGRGTTVGVMAPDGAGKTTLLQGLGAECPLPSRYVYMGLWGSGRWDPVFGRLPGWRLAKKVFRILRGGLAVRYHRALGRLVFLDRVAYDALLPSARGSGLSGAVARATDALALAVGPAPDVLLVLDVPGDVMFARKGEHSPDVLEGWRRGYLELAERLPGAAVLDGDQPLDAVRRRAMDTVWHSLARHGLHTLEHAHREQVHRQEGHRLEGPSAQGRALDTVWHSLARHGLHTLEHAHREGPGAQPESVDPDLLPLHLWRRLDWRFLLPTLQPGRVGYGGMLGNEQVSALRLLDPDAFPVRPPTFSGLRGGGSPVPRGDAVLRADVVFLSSPDRRDVDAAVAALLPGGWVCAQVRRSLLARTGPRTLAGWQRELMGKGFRDVAVYWSAPNLERTARLVPVTSSTAVRDTLALHADVRFGLAKAVAVRLVMAWGMLALAVPEGMVTGRWPATPGEPSGEGTGYELR
ncbi:hypothetical protein [Arthrobacter sp. M4]|uniref:hypothetical protein n=1 Tax=Arthrobacter sp. M4 TaxID=218160 RepID=UPI001CDC71B4|nr:hypothetical protein [Arthrobacter sp. M4]MCA4135034.1 hypothetical protein [Arthrobacter sp. M4]